MANMLFANNCNTTLASSLTNVATTMSVTSATGFPSPTGSQYFYCTLADAATQTTIEIVKVTAVSGTTFTIVRGQDGTTGTIFASGAVVSLRLVAASLNDFPKLDEANTFTGTITFSTPLLATNMVQSTTSTSGYLSNTDWNTFNGKAPAVTYTTNYIPYGQGTTTPNQSAGLQFDGTNFSTTGYATATSFRPSSSTVPTNGMYLPAANSVGIATNSTNRLYIDASGNTGIGTSSPQGKFNISAAGAEGLEIYPAFSSTNLIQSYNRTSSAYTTLRFNALSYQWQVSGTEQMRIHGSGGVSIGNTTDSGAGSLNVNKNILIGTSTAPNQTTNGQLALGAALSIQNNALISAAGSLDLIINTASSSGNAGSYAGTLSVCVSRGNYLPQATHTVYALVGYGTTFTATPLATQNGSGGPCAFTVTSTSAGVITITDISLYGSPIYVYIHFTGTTGIS